MKFNKLGRTGVKVSEICLGTMTWGRQNSEAEGHAQMDFALDQGVNFIDTAELYAIPANAETYGRTEEIIGTWLAANGRRADIVLATKIAGGETRWIRDGAPPDRASIRTALEASLKRLRTDYVDLYQIHWPTRGHYHFTSHWTYDPTAQDRGAVLPQIEEVLETVAELVREGKIRHFGLSNETAWGTMQYLRLSQERDLPRVVTIQNEYNFLRRYYDTDLAELAYHEDVGLMAYSPLAGGALTGKYLDGALPEGTRGAISGGNYRNNQYTEPAIRAYLELAATHDLDASQMALAFGLGKPFMTSVIIGATTMAQLRTNIAAVDVKLSDEVLAGIHEIHKRYPRTL
ncbi:MAG: aldo/keto reductase [Alphaproteobacteria bacterium]